MVLSPYLLQLTLNQFPSAPEGLKQDMCRFSATQAHIIRPSFQVQAGCEQSASRHLPGISRQFQDPSQQFLFHLSHCTVFIRSYCSLSAARLSRYTSAYSLVVTHCSESSRHHYRKMKMDLCLVVVGMVIVGMVTVRIVTHTPVCPTCTYSYASEISILNHSCTSCC